MQAQRLIAIVAASLALGAFAGTARADKLNNDDSSFSGMFVLDRIDGNKDGMVSKAEFMAMMGKAWDMKAKEMKVKADMMSADDYKQMVRWLSRGEKN